MLLELFQRLHARPGLDDLVARAVEVDNNKTSDTDLKSAAAIVIGNEGEGMSRLVSERCDFKVSIPMKGSISSLNASAAAAIMLYEAVRQRS